MIICKDDLVNIKFKLDNKQLEAVYGVMGDLSSPIVKFNRLSKKYFYNDEGLRIPRAAHKSGYILFSTYLSACQYFKNELTRKEQNLIEQFNLNMINIKESYKILNEIGIQNPEYIV